MAHIITVTIHQHNTMYNDAESTSKPRHRSPLWQVILNPQKNQANRAIKNLTCIFELNVLAHVQQMVERLKTELQNKYWYLHRNQVVRGH